MAVRRQIHLIALLAGIACVPSSAQTGPTTPTAPTAPAMVSDAATVSAQAVARLLTLRELGFERDMEFAGLSGSREFYFPLPPASRIESLRLRLPYRSDSAFESRRSLAIEADGRTLYTMALPAGPSTGTIDIPVDPEMVRDGFLAIRLVYGGAITGDRCIDQRVSGAFLAFAADGGLTAALAPRAVDEVGKVAALMPAAVDIVVPDSSSEAQTAAALTLALGNPQARIVPASSEEPGSAGTWQRSRIALVGAAAPALELASTDGLPEIRIGGSDPAAAARLLRSRWRALAGATSVAQVVRNQEGETPDRVTFADLDGDTSVQNVSDRGIWTTSLPVTALPPSTAMEALVVDAAVADDGGVTPPVVSVLMNGLLLGSAEAKSGARTRLDLAIPEGLARSRNSVEVSVTRQVASGDCTYAPQGYPAQVLPSSHVRLTEAGDPGDFSDLAAVFGEGFSVRMEGPQQVPGTASLLQSLAGGGAPVFVTFDDAPESGPYVHVGPAAPAGSSPSIEFTGERVEIAGEDGRILMDSEALGALTVVQMLEAEGRPVLWIRPGDGFDALAGTRRPIDLAYGDIALVSDERVELAFSSERDRLIDIRYPDRSGFGDFLARYRLWLIAIAWLIASIGFVYLLRRVYATRNSPD